MVLNQTMVELVDSSQAQTDEEQAVCEILSGINSSSLTALIEQVSRFLYNRSIQNGGWVVDIGIWGNGLFRKEAEQIIRGMDKRCIKFISIIIQK